MIRKMILFDSPKCFEAAIAISRSSLNSLLLNSKDVRFLKIKLGKSVMSVILNILISVLFFGKLGFVIIPIATSISSWINVILHFYFIKKHNFHDFDKIFIYKFPRMIFSTVVMGTILYFALGFFSDRFSYNESWKIVYLFIIVSVSLLIYFFVSNFSGAFKLKDIKLR